LKAFRRVAAGNEMQAAFESNIPETQIEAIRAALYVPSPHAEEWIDAGLRTTDVAVRSVAAEIGVAHGIDLAWEAVIRRAQRLDANAGPYLKLIAMLGSAAEHDIVYSALRVPELQPQAIWALGHIGTVRAVESCLAGMQYEKLARACGEAYAWITGADLARDGLAAEETVPEVPAFEDEDLDADLVPPPEALWPLPDPEATRRHWDTRRDAFAENGRHVQGRPAGPETLIAMVENGPMLRRPDLVLELRARSHGRYDVEPRAFTSRQRQMMATARAAFFSHEGR
jgi:uncharacterized protein (TIGR02270 family)